MFAVTITLLGKEPQIQIGQDVLTSCSEGTIVSTLTNVQLYNTEHIDYLHILDVDGDGRTKLLLTSMVINLNLIMCMRKSLTNTVQVEDTSTSYFHYTDSEL